MTDRYTPVQGRMQLSDTGEFVRYEDFERLEATVEPLQQRAATAESELGQMRPAFERAQQVLANAQAARDRLSQELTDARALHAIELGVLNDQVEQLRARVGDLEAALQLMRHEVDRVLPPPPAVPQEQLELMARDLVERVGAAIKGG